MEGQKFVNVFQPCMLGWAYEPELTAELGRLVADTCVWPFYEAAHGQYRINDKLKEKKPVLEFMKTQGCFRHILRAENKPLLDEIQEVTEKNREELLKKES